MNKQALEATKTAGKITSQVVAYAKTLVKKDCSLFDLAESIEQKIIELGGKPAFPVNLSINEVAAHSTPTFQDTKKAHGLLKVDIGVHIEGYAADTAFSVDLENSSLYGGLIAASEAALTKALETVKKGMTTSALGKIIEETVEFNKAVPVYNLTGHSIEQFSLHAGVSIPNYEHPHPISLEPGVYAIEPFTTSGIGKVIDGKPSGIFHLSEYKPVRDQFARKLFEFIESEYETLPFCERWLVKQFGQRARISLKLLEQAGAIYQYPQLVEESGAPVAQSEHTIILGDSVEIITK